jgi:hypothetical protein
LAKDPGRNDPDESSGFDQIQVDSGEFNQNENKKRDAWHPFMPFFGVPGHRLRMGTRPGMKQA